jgi:glycosyltransferase involved in cell wall biosynthesis
VVEEVPGAPAVSVIVPTIGRALLDRAVASVLAQTYADLEVIVVADGPMQIAPHPDPRVRLVVRPERGGPPAARNSGLDVARGRYIAFLDDDDLWLPEKLARQVPVLEDGADVVHSLVFVADGDGRVYERASERGFRLFREVAAAGYPYAWLLRRSSYQIGTFVVRRDAVDAVGGFDESLPLVEDLWFVHELWRRYDLHLVDEPLSMYCFHDANGTRSTNPEVWVRLAERELDWIASHEPPGRSAAEAYLLMQIAQARWIGGRPRQALRPALRAHALDPTVVTMQRVAKYAVAAALPAALAARIRSGVSAVRPVGEPDPWLDLPTLLASLPELSPALEPVPGAVEPEAADPVPAIAAPEQ